MQTVFGIIGIFLTGIDKKSIGQAASAVMLAWHCSFSHWTNAGFLLSIPSQMLRLTLQGMVNCKLYDNFDIVTEVYEYSHIGYEYFSLYESQIYSS